MLDDHFVPRKLLDWGKDSTVHWAKQPQEKAVIFIHGFWGSPNKTFNQFDTLFRDYNQFEGYDVFFYGYDSLRKRASASGIEFCKFLDYLSDSSDVLYKSSNKIKTSVRSVNFKYKKLVIVSHSLGAVITRLALLDANHRKYSWVNKADMIMYAPAHLGTDLISLSFRIFPHVWKVLPFALMYKIVTLRDLRHNSSTLQSLIKETKNLQNNGIGDFTKSKGVFWAEFENVVISNDFPGDPPAEIIPETTHFTVCKPQLEFLPPIDDLLPYL